MPVGLKCRQLLLYRQPACLFLTLTDCAACNMLDHLDQSYCGCDADSILKMQPSDLCHLHPLSAPYTHAGLPFKCCGTPIKSAVPVMQTPDFGLGLQAIASWTQFVLLINCCGTLLKTALAVVQIADFGLSRHASATTMDTETYGTVTHMPPELLMDGKLTKSADVYAFGVLLWEMYTGRT